MMSRIRRNGNSLSVNLPREELARGGFEQNDLVEVTLRHPVEMPVRIPKLDISQPATLFEVPRPDDMELPDRGWSKRSLCDRVFYTLISTDDNVVSLSRAGYEEARTLFRAGWNAHDVYVAE